MKRSNGAAIFERAMRELLGAMKLQNARVTRLECILGTLCERAGVPIESMAELKEMMEQQRDLQALHDKLKSATISTGGRA